MLIVTYPDATAQPTPYRVHPADCDITTDGGTLILSREGAVIAVYSAGTWGECHRTFPSAS